MKVKLLSPLRLWALFGAAAPEETGDARHGTGNAARELHQLHGENQPCSLPQSPGDAKMFPEATGSECRDSGVI